MRGDRGRFGSLGTLGALLTALSLAVAAPVFGAGFGIFEQGTRAMGMAGAFTAQADDPSAMFHNVGGLAFLDDREFTVGTTLITFGESEFQGAAPFPGPTQTGEQESAVFFPSHIYYVEPLTEELSFGLSFNSPFALATEWEDPDAWAGRFISYNAEINTFDLTPNIGWQATPNLGLGLGVVARFSDVMLRRRQGAVNPFTQNFVDIADSELESDFDEGFGFTVGLLHKATPLFSWGLSYRSSLEIDYEGDASFRQIQTGFPEFDAAVAASLPDADVPVSTTIDFPDMASLGFAYQFTPAVLAELDVNWTGWSSFDRLVVDFEEGSGIDPIVRDEDWDDAYNYRLGVRYTTTNRSEWRIGYVFDETPQPEKSVSPLLPDADRNGVTVGYGREGESMIWDVAVMYLPFDERTTRTNDNNFLGSYDTTAWLLGFTVGWR